MVYNASVHRNIATRHALAVNFRSAQSGLFSKVGGVHFQMMRTATSISVPISIYRDKA
jgi:hypothetical protein